jgi:hypothetical protein
MSLVLFRPATTSLAFRNSGRSMQTLPEQRFTQRAGDPFLAFGTF